MDVRDLGQAMRIMGALITDQEVSMLIKKYDPDNTGFIANTDFQCCLAEIQDKPDGEKQIRQAFSIFDKHDQEGNLQISEMKHVLERIGDSIKDSELKSFFDLVDNGTDFCNMEDIIRLLKPQTTKDLYSKKVLQPT